MSRADRIGEIVVQRLRNQRLIGATFATPAEVVGWQCAVQAQDYRGALWAVAQRTFEATEAAVEQALADRTIVRSWPMRGTLHFCAPADLRWLLALLAGRVIARSASRHRELGLDASAFARSETILRRALEGGRELTRDEAYAALDRGKVATAGQRGIHILGRLALGGVLCFGAPRGKQQTFALLDDWIPTSRTLDRDEALAELAHRYIASHAPATLADFTWWSGLAIGEARRALELAGDAIATRVIAGTTFYESTRAPSTTAQPNTATRAATKKGPTRTATTNQAPRARGGAASQAPREARAATGRASRAAAAAPTKKTQASRAIAARVMAKGTAHLLPAYDEYTVAYRDRGAILDPAHATRAKNGIFAPVVLLDGAIAGTWKRLAKRDRVAITAELFAPPTRAQRTLLEAQAERYGAFLGVGVTFTV